MPAGGALAALTAAARELGLVAEGGEGEEGEGDAGMGVEEDAVQLEALLARLRVWQCVCVCVW